MVVAGALHGAVANGAGTAVYPRETDRSSARHSALSGKPSAEILRIDLDKDGDPDIIERWWNGKRVRWFDENDDATGSDTWGDMIHDALQVDKDGDGFYDGPNDYNVKWADTDGDGIPDLQGFNSNPQADHPTVFANAAVYFVTIDPDNTGLLMDIDWNDLSATWTRYQKGPNWNCNYHGNAAFLKEHVPVWAIETPEYSWENPFLFFDPDGDGLSEVSVRVADDRIPTSANNNSLRFDGVVDEAWVSYDLDNDTGRDNETDYDMTLYVGGGPGLDYKDQIHDYPQLRAPDWAKPYYRHFDWRQQTRFVYLNRDGAVNRLFGGQWAKAYLTVDEDDDSHRWERVELYYPGDPYVLKRADHNSPIWHNQSDSLGDRGEWDTDFSGKAKLYRAAWDGKIHLLGAERGAWMVDRNREFWGAAHNNGVSSTKMATQVREVIQYRDTDGNGYLDTIIYDYDGDKTPERTDSLLALGVDDKGTLLDVTTMDWDALRIENSEAVKRSWAEAQRLYRLAFRHGYVDAEIFRLSKASSVGEKADKAYWLQEHTVRKLLAELPENLHTGILRSYYLHDMKEMGRILETATPIKPEQTGSETPVVKSAGGVAAVSAGLVPAGGAREGTRLEVSEGGPIVFNFGPADTQVPAGVINTGAERFSSQRGWGWNCPADLLRRRGKEKNVLKDTLALVSASGMDAEFAVQLAPGRYVVEAVVGDPGYPCTARLFLQDEPGAWLNEGIRPAGEYTVRRREVELPDGLLRIRIPKAPNQNTSYAALCQLAVYVEGTALLPGVAEKALPPAPTAPPLSIQPGRMATLDQLASAQSAVFQLSDADRPGAWCWFQDKRVIVDDSNPAKPILLTGVVTFADKGSDKRGDIDLYWALLNSVKDDGSIVRGRFELDDQLQMDDHASPSFMIRTDGRYLVNWSMHGNDCILRTRISEKPGNPTAWSDTIKTQPTAAGITYTNPRYLADANNGKGVIFNGVRSRGFDSNFVLSDDLGLTWRYGGRTLDANDPWPDNPEGGRAYVKYAGDGKSKVHLFSTDDHPRVDFNADRTARGPFLNSIYHAYIENNKLHRTDGTVIDEDLSDDNAADPPKMTMLLKDGTLMGADAMRRGWVDDIDVGPDGQPVGIIQFRANDNPDDHRYFYARYDGSKWHVGFLAYGGDNFGGSTEPDYTGLASVDPSNPDVVFISTSSHPVTGAPLISTASGQRQNEIFMGRTSDFGATWTWAPVTQNSMVDNLRPIVPKWTTGKSVVLWMQGSYPSFYAYDTKIVGQVFEHAPAMSPAAAPAATAPSVLSARFVPERQDDFAWENDLIAFRAYGPALRKNPENAGIDCWLKRVNYPIIDKWYGQMKTKSYHTDWGEGHDPYHVGSSAGCGGTALWINGKREALETFVGWEIVEQTAGKSVFALTYENTIAGNVYKERKQITIEPGKRLFQVDSTFWKDGRVATKLPIAIGVTTHDGKAVPSSNKKEGWIACWENLEGAGLGTGVAMSPSDIKEIIEMKSTGPDTGHVLIITETDAFGRLVYHAGYGWEKAGAITTEKQWQVYLKAF